MPSEQKVLLSNWRLRLERLIGLEITELLHEPGSRISKFFVMRGHNACVMEWGFRVHELRLSCVDDTSVLLFRALAGLKLFTHYFVEN